MLQEIYIIDDKAEFIEEMKKIFNSEKEYHFVSIKSSDMDIALQNIPSLIIVEDDNTEMNAVEICKNIRKNDDNSITPVIVVSSNSDHDYRIEILGMSIQYYILKPIDEQYFFFTIKNLIELVNTNRRMSPLTGLPGNVQIQTEMKKRLLKKVPFAVLYLDLDNFKAYNDVYGFSNGDEIIKLLARITVKHVHDFETNYNFVGHIGGDDFVAIVEKCDYEKLCKEIIDEFDERIVSYYTEEDVERGYVEVANRRGIIEEFPLTTLSIAVVEVESGAFESTLEIGEVSAQIKHLAKETIGSAYVINRRKSKNRKKICRGE